MGEPVVICATCGSQGKAKISNRGSVLVFLALCVFFLIPGLLYLVYMLTGNYTSCRSCGSREVVKVDTPRGRELAARYAPSAAPAAR